MLIKYPALALHLKHNLAPIYVLTGQDIYLLEQAGKAIKTQFKMLKQGEEKVLSIQSADDWSLLAEEANSYSLFSKDVLIDAYLEKKTMDAPGKTALTHYLKSINPRCLILLRAPNVPSKQLQWLSANPQVVIVVAHPMTASALRAWIINQLKINTLRFEPEVPQLIQQYTEGNRLACAQAIEKIALTSAPNSLITGSDVTSQLIDQSEYQLFDLTQACLQGDAAGAIHVLRQSAATRVEPLLILWMLSHEIRLLLQLSHLLDQKVRLADACAQLKIGPNRISLYQQTHSRITSNDLSILLRLAKLVDEDIKSSQNSIIWHRLECIALSICLGRLV